MSPSSPSSSLISSDSSISSCSDISVEASSCDRDFGDESSSTEDSSSSSSSKALDLDFSVSKPKGVDENGYSSTDIVDGDFLQTHLNDELDVDFWIPPEPLNEENYDELGPRKLEFEEEKLRALENVKNGRFKGQVGRLFRSAGVDFLGIYGENWVDKVTSLSWEAASFVKPTDAMDTEGYVKVKCVATGRPLQSKVIKGLVFKKHAAHKHMPTSYRNPRLLLINGSLDLSSDELSSFESIDQEKDSLRPIMEMIEKDQPNVILVEKSVSRDIQESVLEKGMTLIVDMRLRRQQRVASCIGSSVPSSEEAVMRQLLKQCESFYVEKYVEEHDFITEGGGKKPIKTLMFLEGSPNRAACTVLLMGDRSSELKRIKRIVRIAVNMAYHSILETSFLLDQSAMLSSIYSSEAINLSFVNKSPIFDGDIEELSVCDVPITDGINAIGPNVGVERVENNNSSVDVISQSGGFQTEVDDDDNDEDDEKPKLGCDEGNEVNGEHMDDPAMSYPGTWVPHDSVEQRMLGKNERSSEGILVVMSARNAEKGAICNHSHFSRIKFYRSFDAPLGELLRGHLLNQGFHCITCGESNESHVYHYANHDKQLAIKVKQLRASECLPGGNIWMWGRFGHHTFQEENASTKLAKRVPLSSDTERLSFGKFLELSFANFERSFHRDFFYFFGLGPMVAMFKYSPFATHSISLPPQKMDFDSNIRGELLQDDFERAHIDGISMFLDVENTLKELKAKVDIRDVLAMLEQEKARFEANLKSDAKDYSVHRLVSLNRARLDLLLEAYVWDRRISTLTSFKALEYKEESIAVEYVDGENSLRFENNSSLSLQLSTGGDNLVVHDILIQTNSNDGALVSNGNEHSCPCSGEGEDEDDKRRIWAPFEDIRNEYMEVLQRGYLPKIESFGSYGSDSFVQKLIIDESSRLHIPLCKDNIVSDYEDQPSSVIACALALLKDVIPCEVDGAAKGRGSEASKSLARIFSLTPRSDSFDGVEYLDPSSVSSGAHHPEISMGFSKYPSKRKYSVVCLYANEFRKLRDRSCPSEVDFIACLSRCENWDAKGGKSGSFFAKTLDGRFIIKGIKRIELESFTKFAENYFEYMNQCYELGNQTCLAKILGIYQVVIRATNGAKETRHDLVVMENLSFGWSPRRQYDLKGALHARLNVSGNDSGEVLLDQNFVNDVNALPLYVSSSSKRNLQRAVYNDTNFLNSINVMDYSLLVGVDTQRNDMSCGIIDYLRQYTWDKQLENWVKSSLVVPKNQLPTIISPIEYKKRFRKFINAHFLSVPDHWCDRSGPRPYGLRGPKGCENRPLSSKKTPKRGKCYDNCAHATGGAHGGLQQWSHHLVC